MSQPNSVTRRAFLKVSAAAGGGLLIGFYLPGAGPSTQAAASADSFEPNAWLRIGTDNQVTIMMAKSEMGQGVMTSMPMLVTEELEAEWDKIRIEGALSDPVYATPGRGQQTGGSTSVRTSWQMLRQAGAVGRMMLISAAALIWGVEEASCRAEKGTVVHTPSGRRLTFGELAAKAAALPVPKEVALKDPKDFRLLGRPVARVDIAEAVQVSRAVGAPVKVVWTREDDMQHDFYRPASYHHLQAALDERGMPVAWSHRLVCPSIMSRTAPDNVKNGIDPVSVEGAANLPYSIPNLKMDYIIQDPGIPVGFWRSVGNSIHGFVTECFFDEVAAAGGKDPVELRRTLLDKAPRHKAVLELAAKKAGWSRPLPAGRFHGISVHKAYGSFVAEVAEVSVAKDGSFRVHRVVCAVDCGPIVNPDTIKYQMESGIVYGLTALKGEITIKNGRVEQGNFDTYPMLRMPEMPEVEVYMVPSNDVQGGAGEPGTPPIASAVANALFAATGKRIRRMPVRLEDLRGA